MTTQLIAAIITITLALCFYTVGVFSERRAHSLQKRHVILFWCGLVFDTTGTTIMSTMAHGSGLLSPHGITAALAIVLMLFHAVWATLVYTRGNAEKQHSFHRFSILVWLIWLIPYVLGMFLGMQG